MNISEFIDYNELEKEIFDYTYINQDLEEAQLRL